MKTCCRNKRQQEEPPVGLEAGSQLKSQGKWLGLEGPSVGLYVHLLEFNQHYLLTVGQAPACQRVGPHPAKCLGASIRSALY